MTARLHHMAFRCRDTEETRAFYEDVIGLPLAAALPIEESKTGRPVRAMHSFFQLKDGSYILSEWNCPLTDVARDYRQLCERELQVYRELLGTEVFRESRIAGGATRCVYRVLRPKKQRQVTG